MHYTAACLPDGVSRAHSFSFLILNKLHILQVYSLTLLGYTVQHGEESLYVCVCIYIYIYIYFFFGSFGARLWNT